MSEQIGVVQSVIGLVIAQDSVTGASRTLAVGSPVFRGEVIKTMDGATVLVEFIDGEKLSLGRMTEISLTDDVVPSRYSEYEEPIVDMTTLDQLLVASNESLDNLDLNELEATAAGENEGSANEGGVVIARLGLQGDVNSGFATGGLADQQEVGLVADIFSAPESIPEVPVLPVVNTAPQALIVEGGSTLLGLIGADKALFDGKNLIGGVYNSAIELGVLDLLNYQPNQLFLVHDKEDNIDAVTLSIDNGVTQDLLGLSHLLGHQEFSVTHTLPGLDYQLSDNGQVLTIRSANGTALSDEIANIALAGVDIVDTSTLGTLLNSSLRVGAGYSLYVIDLEGEETRVSSPQALDISLLQNQTNSGLSDLLDIPVLNALQPVMNLLDQLLGGVDDSLLQTILGTVDTLDIVTDPLDPIGSLVNGLVNDIGTIVSGLTDPLGESFLGDSTIGLASDNLIEDIVAALLNVPGTSLTNSDGLLQSLLGGDPNADPATQGTVDQLLGGVTNLVDGILGTQTQPLDDGLNLVTTDLQELLTNEQSFNDFLTSLLGGNPELATAGSVDELLAAVTGTLDQLTGESLNLSHLDDSVNWLTTDVEQLLNGTDGLQKTLQDILGTGTDLQGGSADQLLADLTDSLDGLLGTNISQLDTLLNETTTTIVDLLSLDKVNLNAGLSLDNLLGVLSLDGITLSAQESLSELL
ncbi:retention module-containing protein [Thiomicrorhabdus sp. 6S2-11]|uniref:Retention module-containing protein n=1 Tax=Thiomicrorhabdus marina TaxID=2818442 RepID=A0ABS3Q796_9GAMM|nr:retention module-containing protein [Thiomicrorhabdus marina]MBO1928228.1 retention module-containing protein [Thiomicrorhabdus marina]